MLDLLFFVWDRAGCTIWVERSDRSHEASIKRYHHYHHHPKNKMKDSHIYFAEFPYTLQLKKVRAENRDMAKEAKSKA